MSLTIGARFKLAIAILCTLLVVVGGIVWRSLRAIRSDAVSLQGEVMPGVTYSAKIGAYNAQYFIVLQQLCQDLDFEVRAAAKKELPDLDGRIAFLLKKYEAGIVHPEDRAIYTKMTASLNAYKEVRDKYIQLTDAGKLVSASDLLGTDVVPAYLRYKVEADALFAFNSSNGSVLSTGISAHTDQTTTIVVLEVRSLMNAELFARSDMNVALATRSAANVVLAARSAANVVLAARSATNVPSAARLATLIVRSVAPALSVAVRRSDRFTVVSWVTSTPWFWKRL